MKTSNLTNDQLRWGPFALAAAGLALLALVAASGLGPALALAQTPATGTTEPGAPGAAGARAWIEYPTEGQTLPLGPVRLVAYATDAEGVDRIELRMNGDLLPADEAEEQAFESARLLLRVDQQWTPDKEGKYILEARGLNTAGGYGEPDFVEFCIGSCEGMLVPTMTPSPSPSPTRLVRPSPSPTPSPSRTPVTPVVEQPAPIRITFTADPTRLLAGQCATLQWNVQGAVAAVQVNGQNVPPLAQSEVCPSQTASFTLVATGDDGARVERQLTIAVEAIAPISTLTPTSTATHVVDKSPQPPADIQFSADNDFLAAGTCTMIRWHVSNVKAYWVDGQPGAGDEGSRQVCPCQTETHTLRVIKMDDSQQDFQVTIRVRGQCMTPTPTGTRWPPLQIVPIAPWATPTIPIIR